MKHYGPKKAYEVIRNYAADGDEGMAARIYAESSISFKRYMDALTEGRKIRRDREATP